MLEDLEGKVEYWMAHYEEDLEMKTSEVQDLKVATLRINTIDACNVEKFVHTGDNAILELNSLTSKFSSNSKNL